VSRVSPDLAVNVAALARSVADDPLAGHVRPRVHTELVADVVATSDFVQYGKKFTFRCDESVGRGGTGAHPSPLRYLLSSIAFCLQVWIAKSAAVADVAIDECHVDVETFMDMRGEHLIGHVPSHPQWFVVEAALTGPPNETAAREVVSAAMERCPVTSLVSLAAPVAVRVTLDGRLVHDTTGSIPDPATTRSTP